MWKKNQDLKKDTGKEMSERHNDIETPPEILGGPGDTSNVTGDSPATVDIPYIT